jgi:hypothetical protein
VLVRAIVWLVMGALVGIVQGMMVVHAVGRIDDGRRSPAARIRRGSVQRTAMSAALLAAAVLDEPLAGGLVALGLLLGRWGFVVRLQAGWDRRSRRVTL